MEEITLLPPPPSPIHHLMEEIKGRAMARRPQSQALRRPHLALIPARIQAFYDFSCNFSLLPRPLVGLPSCTQAVRHGEDVLQQQGLLTLDPPPVHTLFLVFRLAHGSAERGGVRSGKVRPPRPTALWPQRGSSEKALLRGQEEKMKRHAADSTIATSPKPLARALPVVAAKRHRRAGKARKQQPQTLSRGRKKRRGDVHASVCDRLTD
eukprot:scaffold26_cov159-Ochromonas_danica.AAC.12